MKICASKCNKKRIKLYVKRAVVSLLSAVVLVASTPSVPTYAIAEVAVFTLGDFLWSLFLSAGLTFTAIQTAQTVQDVRDDPAFGVPIYADTTADQALNDIRGYVDDSGLCHLFWTLQPEDYGGGGSDPEPTPPPEDSLFKKVFDKAKSTGMLVGASAVALASAIKNSISDDEALRLGLNGGYPSASEDDLRTFTFWAEHGFPYKIYYVDSNDNILFGLFTLPFSLDYSFTYPRLIFRSSTSSTARGRTWVYDAKSKSFSEYRTNYSASVNQFESGFYYSAPYDLSYLKHLLYASPDELNYQGEHTIAYGGTGAITDPDNVQPPLSEADAVTIPSADAITQYITNITNSSTPQTIYQDFTNTYITVAPTPAPQPTVNPYPTYAPAPTTAPRPTSAPEQVEENTQSTTEGLHLEEIFPFCIPFDIVRMIKSFTANRRAPVIEWHYHSNFFNYDVDIVLDFAMFDTSAALLRTLELILYVVGLALLTKFILF